MAKYTTQLITIVRNYSTEGKPLNERIDEAAEYIFPPNYPIWDEGHRAELNHKIIRRYLQREIGFETVELWRSYLETEMFEIMPEYVKIYETTLEKFDGAVDVDLTIKTDRETDSHMEQSGEGSGTDESEGLISDYPQAVVNAADLVYASDGQKSESKNTGTTDSISSGTGTDNTIQTRKGRTGMRTQADLIESFRKTIIDLDKQIINDLRSLFYVLY